MTRYANETRFRHEQPERTGILVTNLGTPDAPDKASVRRYLAEFLSDPRVVEIPRPIWKLLLHGIILRTRPARSAAAYAKVWTEDGSPLLNIASAQCAALSERFVNLRGVQVALGMRYGNPSLASALETLRSQQVRRLLLLPLYPQYSASTTASTIDEVARVIRGWRYQPELRTINSYHDHPGYIAALCESVEEYWAANGRGDQFLFSFHGVPKRYLINGDPYHCQCQKTARLVADGLGLRPEQFRVSFQSRLGRAEWLRPYTDHVLTEMAEGGTRRVDVICPGFSADCLETLEEVAIGYRELFELKGGKSLHYIPALNTRESHIDLLATLCRTHLQGWPTDLPDEQTLGRRVERALALGAAR